MVFKIIGYPNIRDLEDWIFNIDSALAGDDYFLRADLQQWAAQIRLEISDKFPNFAQNRKLFTYPDLKLDHIKIKEFLNTRNLSDFDLYNTYLNPQIKDLKWLLHRDAYSDSEDPVDVRIMYFVAEGLFSYSTGLFEKYFKGMRFHRFLPAKTTTYENELEISKQEKLGGVSYRNSSFSTENLDIDFNIDATGECTVSGKKAPSPIFTANMICICPCAHAEAIERTQREPNRDTIFLRNFLPSFFKIASQKLIRSGHLILVLKANDKYINNKELPIIQWAQECGLDRHLIELMNKEQLEFESGGQYRHAASRNLGTSQLETTDLFVRFVFKKS